MNSSNKAFTLVELLVVLAVAGILALLGVATMKEMTTSMHDAVCMENLRRIGLTIQAGAADNEGKIPRIRNNANLSGLPDQLQSAPTLSEFVVSHGETMRTLSCPADQRKRNDTAFSSYEWIPLFEDCPNFNPTLKLPGLEPMTVQPSEAPLVAEFCRKGEAPPHRAGKYGGVNELMADGHVRTSQIEQDENE